MKGERLCSTATHTLLVLFYHTELYVLACDWFLSETQKATQSFGKTVIPRWIVGNLWSPRFTFPVPRWRLSHHLSPRGKQTFKLKIIISIHWWMHRFILQIRNWLTVISCRQSNNQSTRNNRFGIIMFVQRSMKALASLLVFSTIILDGSSASVDSASIDGKIAEKEINGEFFVLITCLMLVVG